MDEGLSEAVEAIKVAMLLHERYRRDAASVAIDTAVSLDERLLSLDQNYQGLWEQLDRAASLLDQAGHDVAEFRSVRDNVRDVHQGYKQHNELRVSLGGIEEKTTYKINPIRLQHIQHALRALQQAVPGQSFVVERDAEVEQFLASQRGAGRFVKPLIGLGVVVAGVAVVLVVFQWLRPVDYGPHSQEIYALEREVEAEPCNKEKVVQLAELLNQAKAYPATLERAAAYFGSCGELRRLRWATYAAHKRSGNWQGAVAEASKLIEEVPRDRDYRWWRGEAFERAGDLERAIVDYRQAVALEPFLRNIPFNLADLLEQVGRPCEALFWLRNYAHHHPKERRMLVPRVTRLWSLPACSKRVGTGSVTLPLSGSGRGRILTAINDAPPRELVLDPDALFVMLSSELAAEIGLKIDGPQLLVRTAQGFFPTRLARASRVAVGQEGARAEAVDVPLVVGQKLPMGAEGIVGQSFLARFVVGFGTDPPALQLAPVTLPPAR